MIVLEVLFGKAVCWCSVVFMMRLYAAVGGIARSDVCLLLGDTGSKTRIVGEVEEAIIWVTGWPMDVYHNREPAVSEDREEDVWKRRMKARKRRFKVRYFPRCRQTSVRANSVCSSAGSALNVAHTFTSQLEPSAEALGRPLGDDDDDVRCHYPRASLVIVVS